MAARRPRTPSGPIAVATASQRRRRDTGPLTDKGQARKAELVAAARLVFERQGFLDTRVADIVAEANVAQGSFYTYFDSKDTIFRAVARGVIDSMLTALHNDARAEDPFVRVRDAMQRFVDADPDLDVLVVAEVLGAMVDHTCYVWLNLARSLTRTPCSRP